MANGKTVAECMAEIQEKNQEINQLKSKILELTPIKSKYDQLQKQVDESETQKDKEIDRLKKQLEASQNKLAQTVATQTTRSAEAKAIVYTELTQQISEKDAQITELQEANTEWQKAFADLEQRMQSDIEVYEQQFQDDRNTISQQTEHLEQLQENLTAQIQKIADLEAENQSLCERLNNKEAQSTAEFAQVKSENTEKNRLLLEMRQQLEDLKNEYEQYKQQSHKDAETFKQKANLKFQEFKTLLQNLETENAGLRQAKEGNGYKEKLEAQIQVNQNNELVIEKLRAQNKQLTQNVAILTPLQATNETQKQRIQELEQERDLKKVLEKNNAKLSSVLSTLGIDVSDVNEVQAQANEKNKALQEERREFEQKLQSAKNFTDQAAEQIQEKETKINQQNDMILAQSGDLTKGKETLQKAQEALNQAKQDLNAVKALNQDLNDRLALSDSYQPQIENIQQEFQEYKQQTEKEKKSLNTQITNLTKQNKKLENDLEQKDTEYQTLQQENQKLQLEANKPQTNSQKAEEEKMSEKVKKDIETEPKTDVKDTEVTEVHESVELESAEPETPPESKKKLQKPKTELEKISEKLEDLSQDVKTINKRWGFAANLICTFALMFGGWVGLWVANWFGWSLLPGGNGAKAVATTATHHNLQVKKGSADSAAALVAGLEKALGKGVLVSSDELKGADKKLASECKADSREYLLGVNALDAKNAGKPFASDAQAVPLEVLFKYLLTQKDHLKTWFAKKTTERKPYLMAKVVIFDKDHKPLKPVTAMVDEFWGKIHVSLKGSEHDTSKYIPLNFSLVDVKK